MKQSINRKKLDDSRYEKILYQVDIKEILSKIRAFPNYDCDIMITYEDDYHKNRWSSYCLESSFYRLEEYIQLEGIQDRVDIFVTDKKALAFRAYGNSHLYPNKMDQLITLVTIKCYEEGMSPIDMNQMFDYFYQVFPGQVIA